MPKLVGLARRRRSAKPKKPKVAKSVISGEGWSIVNIDAKAGCELVLTTPRLARAFYDVDANLVDYYETNHASPKFPVNVPVGSLRAFAMQERDTNNDDEMSVIAKHLRTVLDGRLAMVQPYLRPGDNAVVPFDLLVETLSHMLKQTVVFTDRWGAQIVGRLVAVTENNWFGRWVEVTYECWQHGASRESGAVENALTVAKCSMRLFPGIDRSLRDNGIIIHIDDAMRAKFVERGRRCVDLMRKCTYVRVDGILMQKDGWGQWKSTTAVGRAVVDPIGAKLHDQDTEYYDGDTNSDRIGRLVDLNSLSDDDMLLVSPYVVAFGFASKTWGRIYVDQVHPITFRENAFDMLVLPEDDKRLMLSLVRNLDPNQTADFVDGKGGGCAMLFHGKPGLGKTLSAEAIAEVLKRPLYAVGIGELGVTPEKLEERLTRILGTAQRWNAVLLLDEADVFLEERSERDIVRNAMVGVFLRLLEYYNGVLILTTNRVQHIDEAFFARVSLAIKFEEFSVDQRAQVIRNLMSLNSLTVPDEAIQSYANKDVNGRQLKNSIRIARIVANDEKRTMTIADVEMITERMRKFRDDVRRANQTAKQQANGTSVQKPS